MIALTTLLAHLTRPEVTEVCLVTGQRPTARLGRALQDIDEDPLSADDLLRMLFSAGGSRYVDSLGPKPAQWRTRVEGVGAVTVSAAMNDDVIEARFALREATAGATAQAGATAPPPQPLGPSVPPKTKRDHGERPSSVPTPPRGFEMPREALPSNLEIDLEIEVPSVPGAPSPRALPEAGFGHDEDRGPPAARAPVPTFGSDGGSRPQTAGSDGGSRPQTPGSRPDPDHRAARTPGRNTRPFEREPHTAAFRKLLRAARELSASDLHLISGRPPLVRVAGQMVPRGDALDPQLVEDMLLARIPKRLEDVLARDGSCDFAVEEPDLGRFRVNVSRQRSGLKASLRLVSLHVPTLAMLGLPEAIGGATRHHQGLIVLTGPTGHGKTTTLAAVVDILNTESSRHVITVEDPIEYIHPRKRAMMSQREVGTHTRSFQSALKAALREDPDVIVIGELRDTETVRIALEASETGHLVLGTMSTPSAAKAIDRIIDLFPPADQQQVRMTLAGGLRLIVSQRLLPDTEGKGMVAAAEVLPGILPLWNLIRENRTYQIPSLQQRGKELGVIRLDDSLRDLVRAGRVTPAAAITMAEAPDELEQTLGIRRPSQTSMAHMQAPPPVKPPGPPTPEPKGIFDRVFKKGG